MFCKFTTIVVILVFSLTIVSARPPKAGSPVTPPQAAPVVAPVVAPVSPPVTCPAGKAMEWASAACDDYALVGCPSGGEDSYDLYNFVETWDEWQHACNNDAYALVQTMCNEYPVVWWNPGCGQFPYGYACLLSVTCDA